MKLLPFQASGWIKKQPARSRDPWGRGCWEWALWTRLSGAAGGRCPGSPSPSSSFPLGPRIDQTYLEAGGCTFLKYKSEQRRGENRQTITMEKKICDLFEAIELIGCVFRTWVHVFSFLCPCNTSQSLELPSKGVSQLFILFIMHIFYSFPTLFKASALPISSFCSCPGFHVFIWPPDHVIIIWHPPAYSFSALNLSVFSQSKQECPIHPTMVRVQLGKLKLCDCNGIKDVQFSSVTQSCPTLHEPKDHSMPVKVASPTSRVYTNLSPLSWWCHPTISSSVIPFSSHLQSFPASRSFQNPTTY